MPLRNKKMIREPDPPGLALLVAMLVLTAADAANQDRGCLHGKLRGFRRSHTR